MVPTAEKKKLIVAILLRHHRQVDHLGNNVIISHQFTLWRLVMLNLSNIPVYL